MDEGFERSPVDKRDDYARGPRSGAAATGSGRRERSRSRSRSPGARRRTRSRSPSRDRLRRSSRSRSRERRRDDRDGRRSPPRRSRYDDDGRYPHSSTRGGHYSSRGGYSSRGRGGFDPNRRASNREAVAQEAIKTSKKENRVYVGNLSFQVRWHDLKDFCGSVGTVVFAEIIQLPNGMSKGCGVVEYSTREEAQRAIVELNEGQLMGRPVFIREDREDEARYGAAAISNRTSFPGAALQTSSAPPSRGPSGVPAVFAPPGPRGLFVTGMSPNIGWQDLKDLFRQAGSVLRADINMDHTTGLSKGTGVVVMESKDQASAAIAMFNGYEFDGGRLEVREDRFYHINAARGAHGGLRPRGGGRGGYSGGHGGGWSGEGGSSRDTENLYGDYAGPDASGSMGGDSAYGYGNPDAGRGGFGGRGGFRGGRGGFGGERTLDPIPAAPSTQIFVKNLPWSTANEDLVELFQTTGTVQEAEVIWENGRSKGSGIVQFATVEEAETAIAKFQGYQYGGRPLGIAFNARWKDFSGAGQNVAQVGEADNGGFQGYNGEEAVPASGDQAMDA